jgi:outer membrane receptor for ferrienterochelin and colicin
MASYRFGWEHGRLGRAYDPEMMKKFFSIGHQGAWDLGEGHGIAALEEAENSEYPDCD